MINQCLFLPDAHVALLCSECCAGDSIFSRKEIKIKYISNFNIQSKFATKTILYILHIVAQHVVHIRGSG